MDLDDLKVRYSEHALRDVLRVLREKEQVIFSVVAVERMIAIELGSWRRFRGTGLTEELLASLLSPFRVAPKLVRMEIDGNGQPGYERASLEEASRLPLEVWVAELEHRPAISPRARRIRDLRQKREHPVLRKVIQSDGVTPYVVCDAVACYWDGCTFRRSNSLQATSSEGRKDQTINMILAGEYGEAMKDVFLDADRWRHIYDDLIDVPVQAMIVRDSLHLFESLAPLGETDASEGAASNPKSGSIGSRQPALRRSRPFELARSVEPFTCTHEPTAPEETIALQEKATREHHDILVSLHRHLVDGGWRSVEEIPAAIDLWAVAPDGVRVIFEAKTISENNEAHQCRAALAQLLEYRFFYGHAEDELCVVINSAISNNRIRFLESAGVAVATTLNGRLQGVGELGDRLFDVSA